MENKVYSVYVHVTPSDKAYIGITRQEPEKRWNNGYGYLENDYFYNAIKKYGWEQIESIIIKDNLNKQEACDLEVALIKKYETNHEHKGYNFTSGGEVGYTHSQRSISLGLQSRFENGHSPINQKIVNEIREKYATGKFMQKEMCAEYGVQILAMHNIINNHTWHDKNYTVPTFNRYTNEKGELKEKIKNKKKRTMIMNGTMLSNKQVNEIRGKYSTGDYLVKDLAAEYNVHQKYMGTILSNKNRVDINYKRPNVTCYKLNYKKAEQIRELYKTGDYSQKELGDMFGLKQGAISNVILYKTWNRLGTKGDKLEDMKKAQFYLNRLIEKSGTD